MTKIFHICFQPDDRILLIAHSLMSYPHVSSYLAPLAISFLSLQHPLYPTKGLSENRPFLTVKDHKSHTLRRITVLPAETSVERILYNTIL